MRDGCAEFERLDAGFEAVHPRPKAGSGYAVIYLRREGVGRSVADQLERCLGFATGANLEIVAQFEDFVGAQETGLIRAILSLRPGDVLLVESLKRLGTKIPYLNSVYAMVKYRGARILPVDMTPLPPDQLDDFLDSCYETPPPVLITEAEAKAVLGLMAEFT